MRVLGERGAGVLDEPVSAVMTRKVVSCKQSDTVGDDHGNSRTLGEIRHLPVLEATIGSSDLISIGDVVKWPGWRV